MVDTKMVKVRRGLYDEAKRLAGERGLTMANALVEVGAERGSIPRCTEAGFRAELRLAGIEAPPRLGWIFGVLENLPFSMVEGTALEPFAKAKLIAEANCQLLAASLENLENGLAENASAVATENASAAVAENASADATENELADAEALPEVPSPQESAVS